MNDYIKKLPKDEVFLLTNHLDYEEHKVSSLTLAQNKNLIITLFALDADESIGGHASTGDAMVQILDGKAEITVGDHTHIVSCGETIIMPANITHALKAIEPFKMLLTVVKPN